MSNTARTAAPLLSGFCNPYGAETGGPKRVLGGMYGPASAATPGLGLPTAVAQGEWRCGNRAQVRCRMVCGCGHTGQIMQLCSWHDEPNYRLNPDTGKPMVEWVRQRGHYEEIARRQSGSCPRCLFPGDFAALQKEVQVWQGELTVLHQRGLWHSPRAAMIRQACEDAAASMAEAFAQGIIHNCALSLVPVS